MGGALATGASEHPPALIGGNLTHTTVENTDTHHRLSMHTPIILCRWSEAASVSHFDLSLQATPTFIARQRNKWWCAGEMSGRVRSVSEPALRLQCGSVSRERRRESGVWYETGRDRAALSISRWSPEEVCVDG